MFKRGDMVKWVGGDRIDFKGLRGCTAEIITIARDYLTVDWTDKKNARETYLAAGYTENNLPDLNNDASWLQRRYVIMPKVQLELGNRFELMMEE